MRAIALRIWDAVRPWLLRDLALELAAAIVGLLMVDVALVAAIALRFRYDPVVALGGMLVGLVVGPLFLAALRLPKEIWTEARS